MLLTIRVPDNATRLMYTMTDECGYESDPKNITISDYVKVESETNEKDEK